MLVTACKFGQHLQEDFGVGIRARGVERLVPSFTVFTEIFSIAFEVYFN